MSIIADVIEPESAVASDQLSSDTVFDPGAYFDQWWEHLEATRKHLASESPKSPEEKGSGIYIESLPGSNCEVTFEGVLHFDGHSMGNIRSPDGTLVVTKRGRVDADIDVGIAVINGSITGNIIATERVLLDSDARVTGQINTRLLSVRQGAAFEGDCWFTTPAESLIVEELPQEEESEELEQFLVGV